MMDIFVASDVAETVFMAALDSQTDAMEPNNVALVAIKMSKAASWTLASKLAMVS